MTETEEIVKNIEQFKNISIAMATMMHFQKMIDFSDKYKPLLIKMCLLRRVYFSFYLLFTILKTFPFMLIKIKKEKLISDFKGEMPIQKIPGEFGK